VAGPRAIFFCNEQFGLGHLRRSLALAGALVELQANATALVVSGSPATGLLPVPAGVDTLKLPASPVDRHTAWSTTGHHTLGRLDVPSEAVRALRSRLSLAAVQATNPDITIVDYMPLGRGGELRPTLDHLRAEGRSRTVLGLREVDDGAEQLSAVWDRPLLEAVRELYDLVLVYGPEAPGDVRVKRLRGAGVRVRHVDAVASADLTTVARDLPAQYLLVTAGGGIDGFELFMSVIEALRLSPLGIPAVMVTGPMMQGHEIAQLSEHSAGLDVRIEPYRADMGATIRGARAIIAMAGYNTVAELVRTDVPALLVPRAAPRLEQTIRAQRLAETGRATVLERGDLAPRSLRAAIHRLLAQGRAVAQIGRGAHQAAEVFLDLAAAPVPISNRVA
jgi:predicted glycosyltransferase